MKYLYLLLAVVYIVACNHDNEAHQGDAHTDHEMEDHSMMDHSDHMSHQMVMNNGEKWKADATTNEGVDKMKASINNFKSKEPASVEAYQELGENLKMHYSELVRKCTMKGPEHDQLHVFLEHLQPKINMLSSVNHIEKGDEVLNETDALIAEYYNYFN